jgi:putative ABC transport system ATP-binding protein
MSQPLVELVEATKVYGSGESEVRALAGANLRIDAGEFLAVMGPSGSGKSTCLNLIGALDRPTSGHYFFRGVDLTDLSNDQLARFRRSYLGFVFQGYNLLPRTSTLENVELPLRYRGMPAAQRRLRARRALDDVGLSTRGSHTPAELSGGQQQRAAIARAIVTDPAILLADEPTGNLDSARKDEIMRLLVGLNRERGITIVMVTHEPEMAAYTSRTVVFRDGRVERDERRIEAD